MESGSRDRGLWMTNEHRDMKTNPYRHLRYFYGITATSKERWQAAGLEKNGEGGLKACWLASPVPTPQNLTAAIALGPSATLGLRARPAVAGRLGTVAGGCCCCCFLMAIPIVSRLWLRPRITRWREGQQGNRHRDIDIHTQGKRRVAEMLVDKNWEAKKTNPGLPLSTGSQAKKVFFPQYPSRQNLPKLSKATIFIKNFLAFL